MFLLSLSIKYKQQMKYKCIYYAYYINANNANILKVNFL